MQEFFSLQGVFKLRNLTTMGILTVVSVLLMSYFTIYLTPSMRLFSFTYLPGLMVAVLFGPWAALVYGFVANTVGFFFSKSGGPFFFGYALSDMLEFFIYACFLYRREVTLLKVVLAKVLVLLGIIMGLNFLWQVMIWGTTAGSFYTGLRVLVNVATLPVHIFLSWFFARFALKLEKMRLPFQGAPL